jgi:hypothetical protein
MSRVTLLAGRRKWLLALALAGVSGAVIAQKSPESLLPPGFDAPVEPAPVVRPKEGSPAGDAAKAPSGGGISSPAAGAAAGARIQGTSTPGLTAAGAAVGGLSDEELLNSIDPALIKQLEDASRPKYDIPPADSRSLALVGALDNADGGFPAQSTRNLGGDYVSALLTRFKGPLVSRWGQILMRRALVSRLATPVGMNGADWAAYRAQVLLRMGEADAARLMVSQVDNANYTPGLEDAAMDSFLATADPVGLCPVAQLTAADRSGWQWDMTHAICAAFTHSDPNPMGRLDRIRSDSDSGRIDSLLAQKFAGAVAVKRRAVKIEWDKVDTMTPWRFGFSLASGLEPPAELVDKAGGPNAGLFRLFESRAPMLPLTTRAAAADRAGARGVLSASAMVDLYGQILAEGDPKDQWTKLASTLRTAYTGAAPADRMAAIKTLWGDDTDPERAWSRHVLTAYAAARIQPNDAMADDAAGLIGAMLSAGLDANAMQWAGHVARGSQAWGTLALAAPSWSGNGIGDALSTYYGKDQSSEGLRSKFLLAGLMGLERVSGSEATTFAGKLSVNMGRRNRWTDAIDAAAASGNQTLVALLAGFGMQGAGWTKMTPVHLFHIVGALHRVGLDPEARMIAAEAVSRV